MSAKKTGSILLKVVLGVVIVAVVLGGVGMAYRLGTMRSYAWTQSVGDTNSTDDEDCPMYGTDENGGAVNDRYYGGMMGGRYDYWGRGGMMGGRGGYGGMMPFGHGFFPLGGLFGGLLFLGLIVLVVRLLIGGPRWRHRMHGMAFHHMHHEECPYCESHTGHEHQHHHDGEKGEAFEEPELNIEED